MCYMISATGSSFIKIQHQQLRCFHKQAHVSTLCSVNPLKTISKPERTSLKSTDQNSCRPEDLKQLYVTFSLQPFTAVITVATQKNHSHLRGIPGYYIPTTTVQLCNTYLLPWHCRVTPNYVSQPQHVNDAIGDA